MVDTQMVEFIKSPGMCVSLFTIASDHEIWAEVWSVVLADREGISDCIWIVPGTYEED